MRTKLQFLSYWLHTVTHDRNNNFRRSTMTISLSTSVNYNILKRNESMERYGIKITEDISTHNNYCVYKRHLHCRCRLHAHCHRHHRRCRCRRRRCGCLCYWCPHVGSDFVVDVKTKFYALTVWRRNYSSRMVASNKSPVKWQHRRQFAQEGWKSV